MGPSPLASPRVREARASNETEMTETSTTASGAPAPGGVGIIGAGVMGETVLAGVLRAGWPPADVIATDRRPDRCAELTDRYRVSTTDNLTAVRKSATVVLVVKPQDLVSVLDEIAPELQPGALVVSIVAGVPTDLIESRLPERTPVVRVMPNTPAQVSEGMSVVSAGRNAGDEHLARVQQMLSTTGKVMVLPESQQDAVTAISGSGPAYVFLLVEAMVEAGVNLGLPRPTATELAVQTLVGSAKLLRESGEPPAVLRERVTSPGGTTAAALRQLEQHGLRAAFLDALEAARDRGRELAAAARDQHP